jgi:hypothetical protein
VRLEHLFDGRMQYTQAEWLDLLNGGESSGYGVGDGEVTGPYLSGAMQWSNQPRMRADGVWMPNVYGQIATEDGAVILFHMTGYSVLEDAPEEPRRRAIVSPVTFQASDERYAWLN